MLIGVSLYPAAYVACNFQELSVFDTTVSLSNLLEISQVEMVRVGREMQRLHKLLSLSSLANCLRMAYKQITESLNVNIVAIVMPVSWHSQCESMRHLLHQHISLEKSIYK